MARSEYSRLRGIVSKRIERLSAQGLVLPGINLPKSSELKTPSQRSKAEQMLRSFIESTSLRSIREQGLKVAPGRGGKIVTLTEKQVKGREKRARQKQRREDILSKYTARQRGFLKGAKKLKLNISNANIKDFIEYMEVRFSQVVDSKYYIMDDFIDDFQTAIKRDPKAVKDLVEDFHRFQADRESLYLEMVRDNPEELRENFAQVVRDQWRKVVKRIK